MNKYIFFGFFLICCILIKNPIYAKENNFEIFSECADEYEFSCNVIKEVNKVNNVLLKDVKSPVIKRINNDIFMVKISCGSPCQVNFFYGRNKQDSTNEFIAINESSNCLIESDSIEKKIYAREVFSTRKIMIADLNAKEYSMMHQRFDYYNYFKRKSKFLENGDLMLVANDASNLIIEKKIIKPCGGNNELFR